ncbi:MAG: hypothetical protein QOF84_5540 [Streptomyces sp.]|jgi:hypothetical protein|nr:hypothetical protein [Streptomyces sp.]
MTDNKAFKKAVRQRMAETGEAYNTARRALLALKQAHTLTTSDEVSSVRMPQTVAEYNPWAQALTEAAAERNRRLRAAAGPSSAMQASINAMAERSRRTQALMKTAMGPSSAMQAAIKAADEHNRRMRALAGPSSAMQASINAAAERSRRTQAFMRTAMGPSSAIQTLIKATDERNRGV